MKIKSYVLGFLLFFSFLEVNAQVTSGLVTFLNFEDCEVRDATGNNPEISTGLPPMCDCGIQSDAFEFDGVGQFISFVPESNVNALFTRATFSISFYFRPLANNGFMTLFSKRESCIAQRGFDVYYNAQTRELITELSESPTNQLRASTPLPLDRCWQHIVIIRSGTNLRIYVNNRLVIDRRTTSVVQLENERPLEIGTGTCVGNTSVAFNGLMSDIRIYNRDLQPLEVATLFRNQDKINNRDTTIFLGQEVVISAGASCSQFINWTPVTDVSDPFIANPILRPQETTQYEVTQNYGNCIARDTILVTVIDPSSLDCSVLPMANAFTPNGDGLNDVYGISNPFTLNELISFEIYDRNGTPVFVTSNEFDTWDGTFRGALMPPGAYLFLVKYVCDDETLVRSGTFHLIR